MRYNIAILTRKEEDAIEVAVNLMGQFVDESSEIYDAMTTLVALKNKSLDNRKRSCK